jgi:cytochrome bd ubiquinol oxidase subunit I
VETFAGIDATLLARIQFAFTISFHIIFPAFTIGLSAFIATLEILWLRTGQDHYHTLARFWTKIFAVSFAMGVVSGIVLSYQFGTNWSRFSEVIGNTIGPLLGYEVLTAFFLEASFLGVMLFGWNRVPPWLHTLSTIIVAFGTALSGFWILSANSWMHTPAGYGITEAGITYPMDWFEIIFNPSFPYRFAHMMIAAYLTTSLVVLATGARYVMAGRHTREAHTMVRMGLGMVAILAPLQLGVGDLHGLNTLVHQPAKIAAIEAHWDGSKTAPFVIFAWPDERQERNRAEISIPNLGSLILTHDFQGKFPGLLDFAPEDRPPVVPVFFAFRIMLASGFIMIGIGLIGTWLWVRKRLLTTAWFLKPVGHAWPLGFIAILAGWMVTEIGRQPWAAYGILRTVDATSPVAASTVATSLLLFILVYGVVFSVGVMYVYRMLAKGPKPIEPGRQALPNRPLSAAQHDAGDQP